jgi:hypothetical protein
MAALSTSAARPSGSGTSPTTSPDRCSKPAGSDPNYTVDCEEPGTSKRSYRGTHGAPDAWPRGRAQGPGLGSAPALFAIAGAVFGDMGLIRLA